MQMNTKLTSIAIALIATSATAFAVDTSVPGKTRAEVRAELEQAYAQGQLNQNAEFVDQPAIASSKSRDEVRDEAIRAAKAAREPATRSGS
jgi:hypothetical protein